jgi:hypothetical protein
LICTDPDFTGLPGGDRGLVGRSLSGAARRWGPDFHGRVTDTARDLCWRSGARLISPWRLPGRVGFSSFPLDGGARGRPGNRPRICPRAGRIVPRRGPLFPTNICTLPERFTVVGGYVGRER